MAKAPPVFQVVRGFRESAGTKIEISNMPRIRSQDSFGVCFGFSAAVIAQKKACDTDRKNFPLDKVGKPYNCSDIPLEKQISPFSMVAWAKPTEKSTQIGDFMNHRNITLAGGEVKAGTGAHALNNSYTDFSFLPESCYPFDQVANKYGDNKELVAKLVEDLNKLYKDNRKTEANTSALCESCLAEEINERLGTHIKAKNISKALEEATFAEFLHKAVFYGCPRIHLEPKPQPKVGYFPENSAEGTREKLLPKIKEVLNSGNPIQVDGVCVLRDEPTDECTGRHSFVISGYKKVCSAQNQCRDLVKVHNSWDEKWQKEHNDGWVDGQSIIENIDDKPAVGIGILSWLK